MKVLPGVKPIGIIVSSYMRPQYLERLLPLLEQRTKYPHFTIVAHGWPVGGKEDPTNRRCIDILKKFKVEGVITDVLFPGEMGYDENPGQTKLEGIALKHIEKNFPETEYVVMHQDDLEVPKLTPCWLERQKYLLDKNAEDYVFLAARIQRTGRLSWKEEDEIIPSNKSVPAVLRISRMDDIRKMGGGEAFDGVKHWESQLAKRLAESIHKKQGFNTRLFCSHWGYIDSTAEGHGKGYLSDKDYESAYTYSPQRRNQADDKPYPAIDPNSLEPVPLQEFRHDKYEFDMRNAYWNEHIGIQAEGTVDSPRRQKVRDALQEVMKQFPGKYLDMGCGAKKISEEADGLDAWPYPCADWNLDAFDPWAIEDGSYDGIVSSHCLEHSKVPVKEALKRWDRIIRKGGIMAIVVPDGENRPSTICEPSHSYAFTKEVLRLIFKRVLGYSVIKVDNVPGLPENKKDIIIVAQKPL